jgi:hypothetical protein
MAEEGNSQTRMHWRKCSVQEPERTHMQEETMERVAMQQWRTEPRIRAEATQQNRNTGHRRSIANESSDGTDVRWDRREELQIAQREANSRIIDGGTKNEEMDFVEGSTTAEMEEAADKGGAGRVESTATTLGVRERGIFNLFC